MSDLSLALAPWLVALGAATGWAGWLRARRPALRPAADRWALALGWTSLGVATIAWLSRTLAAGHLPLFGTFESAWSLALAILLAAALSARHLEARATVWGVAAVVAAAIVAHGRAFDPASYPLTISERSWVVDVHAILAWCAFAAFVVALGFALHRLWLAREDLRLDARLVFALRAAFVLHSAMLASGSFYKFLLFGSAWTFDPIETLGFAAWISYGTLLHLHLLAGWDGRRLARWSLGLFVLLVISYRGIVYFPAWATYHIFDMDLRIHIVN